MLEILPQVRWWKERVDQMTLLVGDARSTASCGHWSESLHQGRGGFLPARWKPGRFQVGQNENHAPSKYYQAREGVCISVPETSLHPRNIVRPERESVLVCLKCL